MLKKIYLIIGLLAAVGILLSIPKVIKEPVKKETSLWNFMAVDTMKYSRDLARERLNDKSFDEIIKLQVKQIADTGATHIGIATPYDEEFLPMLKRWVIEARRNKLKVWFRGNWSGWENWFEYSDITRAEHIVKTKEFILTHRDIFEDGDVFSGCPECENGGPGDPRKTGDVFGYRQFLIDEYKVTKEAFKEIGRDVASNYFSMNGDVARVIMDKETTRLLDGIVTIDHYVNSVDKFVKDVREIANSSGGKIIIGEFGAPIPDINGDMTEKEQADWLNEMLNALMKEPDVIGLSYWTNIGSSTSIWNNDGTPREAVKVLESFYRIKIIK